MGEFPSKPNQFRPGESGNLSGRPKGIKNLSTLLKEMLEEEIDWEDPLNGKRVKYKFKQHINARLLRKAIDGDAQAINTIFDRTEGKPKNSDTPEHEGSSSGVLVVPSSQGITSEEWERQYQINNAKIEEKMNDKKKSNVVRV